MPGCESLSSRAERLRLTFVRRKPVLQQRKAQRDDLKGRIEQDVADAILDVTAAAEQVEVAQATLDYAQQTLTQSQDRFSAGVTNNIEVIQAQEVWPPPISSTSAVFTLTTLPRFCWPAP